MLVILKTKFTDMVGVVSLLDCAPFASVMSGSVHSFVSGSQVPAHIMLLFLVTDTSVTVKATMHSSLHNFLMEMSECHVRPGNMYPFAAVLVRPLTFKAHCVLVDSIDPSSSATLMCRFSWTGSTGAEG